MLDEYYINSIGSDKIHLSNVPAIWILPVLKTDDASEIDVIVKTDFSREMIFELASHICANKFCFRGNKPDI